MAVMHNETHKYKKKKPPLPTPKKNETEIKRLEEQIRLLQQNTDKPKERAAPKKLTENKKKNKYAKGMA